MSGDGGACPPTEAVIVGADLAAGHDGAAELVLRIRYANGVVGSGTWCYTTDADSEYTELVGSKGRLRFSISAPAPISTSLSDTSGPQARACLNTYTRFSQVTAPSTFAPCPTLTPSRALMSPTTRVPLPMVRNPVTTSELARNKPTWVLTQSQDPTDRAELVWRLGTVWAAFNLVLIALASMSDQVRRASTGAPASGAFAEGVDDFRMAGESEVVVAGEGNEAPTIDHRLRAAGRIQHQAGTQQIVRRQCFEAGAKVGGAHASAASSAASAPCASNTLCASSST